MNDHVGILSNNPIIAAVNDIEKYKIALESPCSIIFLLTGNILNLRSLVNQAREYDKKVFIHFDLMDGLTKDTTGLKFVKEHVQPYGIISTRSSLIKRANDADFFTIQRIFLLDSISFEKGINDIKTSRPDAIEIMPGVVTKMTAEVCAMTHVPVIAGGLIKEKKDVIDNLSAGAVCISTSRKEIWYM
ncbi:glycerol-3-phosphate responsive antiterminator [Vallitalea okinawensis]|uniref:glycerol-3-phosphate responsive antiterminator n=1 Tax=Vallitalea okinawensis TaxID=2078660 RepID=UPI000CFC2405|nr:glycerol-3-phosphate responsive antiterminator [Vallitalea okinawensis]